ncbi:MAG: dihydropteroate synthase [Flavisolibacter sp.]
MFTLNCKGQLLEIAEPIVMGILNVTPDSFYAGSRSNSVDDILKRANEMIAEGAMIIDIGGQSTRPGSIKISAQEELDRVIPAVEAIHQQFPEQLISIDTFYASVAKEAVAAGASIVNDVSAGTIDDDLLTSVAEMRVPYVLMHMKGHPENMQENPQYKNVAMEVFDFLNFKIAELTQAGILDIIVDPGFGFGKTANHNFRLLHELSWLSQMGKPIMVGISRKGTIYRTLGVTAEEALNGSTVMHTIALMNGANILRVHDVKEAMEAVKIYTVYKKAKEQ